MRCPIDPPARLVPGTLNTSAQTAHPVIHINPTQPDHIMGARTGFIREHVVPGDPHAPADPCGLPPSTRPTDPNLIYQQPRLARKPTEQSIQITFDAHESSKKSENATTYKTAAEPADRQAARLSQNDRLARVSREPTREQKIPIEQGLQILQSTSKSSKISSNATTCKTLAATSA